ncbi:hypothetical protein EDB80DRAFT_710986 [Ilyonectria destructans]|nr:hypothetical protein EDB80DRAFT_710986 [Ilyonectria destructans]
MNTRVGSSSATNISWRVSSLTAEQVDKKRALDRANKRHCRAKNKAYIKSLEGMITDLTRRLEEAKSQLLHYQQCPDHVAETSPPTLALVLPSVYKIPAKNLDS